MSTENSTTAIKESFFKKFDKHLYDKENFFEPYLAKLEELTKVKRVYIAYGFLVFLAIYLIIGSAAQLVCNFLGFVWPAYQSLKALESSSKDDDTKWLMYWVTFSLFSVIEFFSDILLDWFPFYFLAKLTFLIWCYLPIESNGSSFMYHRIIRPVFIKNQYQVDNYINAAYNTVVGAAGSAMKKAEALSSKDKDS